MSETLRSRKDAAALGLRKYYTGKECPHGHTCERYTVSGACIRCAVELSKISRGKLNTALILEGKGLATITIQVPKNREIELIMFSNSLLIEEKHEPTNKTTAELIKNKAASMGLIDVEKTPEQLREWAYDNWVSLHGKEIADKFLVKFDAKRRGELEKLLPDYTHDGGIIEHDLMRFERK